ncbi:MAG TPA: hypothetical protein VK886_08680 [Vicinamibacterales bacterium]|nr:hypothetical protein [Vicinamibacterales bacterium]
MRTISCALALGLLLVLGAPSAVAQMPDARAMSGIPLPVAEMAGGSVSVRVVRGTMSNPIAKQSVELLGDGQTKTATTDDAGRATFEGLTPGATVKLRTVVANETLESQEFRVPSQGGLRLILAAIDTTAGSQPAASGSPETGGKPEGAPSTPAQPGTVTLGAQSRIHVELAEEGAEIYYMLDIVNAASGPVEPKTPFAFELPEGATGSAVLEGSSPNATAAGRKVTVRGPFPRGSTNVQVAYRLPYSGGRVEFNQAFPAALSQPVISIVKKRPEMTLHSAVFHEAREMPNEGQVLIVAHAKATPANTPLDVRIDGVPSHPAWPRVLALTLAFGILAAGAWGAATAGRRAAARAAAARQLQTRRDKLIADLAALEQRRRSGGVSPQQYERRRREIMEDLEQVYGDLDAGAAA